MSNIKRLQLLQDPEIIDLYARPIFNKNEQMLYFEMNQFELEAITKFGTIRTKVYFILQLAYFKAKNQFFTFEFKDVLDDVNYVLLKVFKKTDVILDGTITRQLINNQEKVILDLFQYQKWTTEQATIVESHICELLRYYPKTNDALRQLLAYLDNKKIVIPMYRILQDMFSSSIAKENSRLGKLILSIPEAEQLQLNKIITQKDGITQLNTIRLDQKNFKYVATRAEVDKAKAISTLYAFAKEFLPCLLLSKNAIRYYADIVDQYPASRLRRFSEPQQWLHMICFVYYRYQQILDNLITSFMYHTRYLMDESSAYAEGEEVKHNASVTADLPKLAKFLKWFPKRNPNLNHEELNHAAYKILPQTQFPILVKFLEGNPFDTKAATRTFFLKSARSCALYLRPTVLAVPFVFYKDNSDIMDFINVIKKHYGSGKGPSTFKLPKNLEEKIPKAMLPYLRKTPDDVEVDPQLFEFFVYYKMYNALDDGLLCCNESVSYCDIENDLVSDAIVDDVEKIAIEFGYPKIPIYCDSRLDEALATLDSTWDRTIRRIDLGENTGFIIKKIKKVEREKKGKNLANQENEDEDEEDWTLSYDSSEHLDDAFFKTLPEVEIADIVMYIGDRIKMWESFSHLKTRYTKRKQSIPVAVNACILSEAFGIDTEKMAKMSDLNYNLLRSTQEDCIRIDTLCAANDDVCNFIHSLPIFKAWNLMDEKLLADSDGQKLPTSESTIQSRYSQKYLGKSPGLSVYTLITNFVAPNAKNIGLNEYEGHSLYDIIYGNKTNIDVDMVTGDNHSVNKINFVILDSIDVDYVPSIKNIKEAANNLYSVKPTDSYTGLIRPKNVIDQTLIRSKKREILRVLLSLLLQENTQSNIVRKINSSARYTGLKRALFEYNSIFKTTHILNLIDSIVLRKAIRTARNRTEAYHQLQGLIRKIYKGVFKGRKIETNQVSSHAVRLVANCIIAYNAIILDTIYNKMIKEGVSQSIIDKFVRISPIASIHIAFTGKYSFRKSDGNIDVDAMVKALEKHLKQRFWKAS